MRTILLVCHANTARSVMAHALLQRMLAERGALEGVRIRSGGIAPYARDGMLPSLDARIVLREEGIHLGEDDLVSTDLKRHRHLLAEADLMRRVLPADEYKRWLAGFLPRLPKSGRGDWLEPGVVTDPSDPKLAHLDGLNLSRAWMLEGMASSLPRNDRRRAALLAAAQRHRQASLQAVTGQHYEGGHWLGTFAAYLVTGRGLPRSR